MINYGRGLWHIISQTREGRNILFPSFTFSFGLGGQVTSAQLEMGQGGVPRTPIPSPCRDSLTCPRQALPGLRSACLFLSFLSPWTQFPCGCQGRPSLHLPPFCCLPFPAPPWNGVQSVSPAKGPGWATPRRCYVCVCVTVANTPRSLAIRGRFRWVSGLGDKERKSGAVFGSGSSRGREAGGLIC